MNRNEFNFQERFERLEKLLLINKRVLTLDEACLMTGFSRSKMYKLTSNQEESGIPAKRPTGGAILFDKKELEDWCLKDHSNSAESRALNYVFNNKRS